MANWSWPPQQWQQAQTGATQGLTQYGVDPVCPQYATQPYITYGTVMTVSGTGPYVPAIPYGLSEGDVVYFIGGTKGRHFYDGNNWKVLPDEPYRIKKVWTRTQGVDLDYVIETIDGHQIQGVYPGGYELKKNDFLTAVDRAKRDSSLKNIDNGNTDVVP